MDYRPLSIDSVYPRERQVRQVFDDEFIDELAASIRKEGILVPIIVRGMGDGYEIVAGEQRWRAAKKIGLSEVPVSIIDADEKRSTELAFLENVKRKDLAGWEREDAIAAMWASGRYGALAELAEVLDVRTKHLENVLAARDLRREEDLPNGASTRMITAISSLDAATRRTILAAQEKGDLPKDIHETTRLVSHIRKAPEMARPKLVEAYASRDLPMEAVEKVAEVVNDDVEVEQLVEAKRSLPPNEFSSVVSYVKGQKEKGKTPVIKTVIKGDVHIWNSYLNSVESIRDELATLKESKCAGWPVEERNRLMNALNDIEVQVQSMLRALGGY